jgi:predicted  nucleic acid-binding Zn-ribbon protein
MMLTKLKVLACVLLSLGMFALGGRALVGQVSKPQKATPEAASKPAKSIPVDREKELIRSLLEAARKRLEAQRKYYEEGRITIDRYCDASFQLKEAELLVATTREQRIHAVRANLDRLREVEAREKSALEAGRGTQADLSEATLRREQAELEALQAEKREGRTELNDLERRLATVEEKLDRVIKSPDVAAPENSGRR